MPASAARWKRWSSKRSRPPARAREGDRQARTANGIDLFRGGDAGDVVCARGERSERITPLRRDLRCRDRPKTVRPETVDVRIAERRRNGEIEETSHDAWLSRAGR